MTPKASAFVLLPAHALRLLAELSHNTRPNRSKTPALESRPRTPLLLEHLCSPGVDKPLIPEAPFDSDSEMIFLSWARPSPEDQRLCINKSGTFNYEAKYRGATAKPASSVQKDSELSEGGFFINHARTLVGSGLDTFERGKEALKSWRHFGLDWAFVDPKTPIQNGEKFCVCVKEFLPWVMMPLQVVYINDNKSSGKAKASFGFGSGTLQGHLLAGEERFSITLDEDNKVWYEIVSFSKPGNFLLFIGYPYVLLRQKFFAYQSSIAVRKHLSSKKNIHL